MLITRRIALGVTVSLFLMMVVFASVNGNSKVSEKREPAARADCATDVKNALEARFKPNVISSITVKVKGSTVTLTGTLNYSPTKNAVAKTVRGVACVKKVVNKIQIRRSGPEQCTSNQEECCNAEGQCVCVPKGTVCPQSKKR